MDPLLFTQQDAQASNGASARASRNVPASVSQGIYQFIYGSQPQSSMATPAALPGPAQGQWSPRPPNSNVASEASVVQSQRINGDRERSDVERLLEFVGLTSSDPLRVAGELGAGARRAFERSAELGEQVGSSVMSRYFLGEWPENWQESTWQGFFEDRWREVAPEASDESIREAAARSARAASLVQYEPLDLLLGDAADAARVGGTVVAGAVGAIPLAERTVQDIMNATGRNLGFYGVPDQILEAGMRGAGAAEEVTGTNLQSVFRGQAYPNPSLQQEFMDVQGRNLLGPAAYLTESKAVAQEYAVPPGLIDENGVIDQEAADAWLWTQQMKTGDIDLSMEDFAPTTTRMLPAVTNPFDFRKPASDLDLGGVLQDYLDSDRFPVEVVEDFRQSVSGQRIAREELMTGAHRALEDHAVWFAQALRELEVPALNLISDETLQRLKSFETTINNDIRDADPDEVMQFINGHEQKKREMFEEARELIIQDLRQSGQLTQEIADEIDFEFEQKMRKEFSSEYIFSSIMDSWAEISNIPKYEIDPMSTNQTSLADTFNYYLRDNGYDGLIHLGGTRIGTELHDVVAVFNKSDVIETYDDLMRNIFQNQISDEPVVFSQDSVDALMNMFPELEEDSFTLAGNGYVMNFENDALLDLGATLEETQTPRITSRAGQQTAKTQPTSDPYSNYNPDDDYDMYDDDDIFDAMDF